MAKRIFSTTNKIGEEHLSKANNKQNKTLIEHAYSVMRYDIITGALKPNEKLRVAHLQKRYEISASTLREAMSRLVSEYLVIAEGQRGYKVCNIDLDELNDITNLRVLIEVNAVRDSVRHGNQEWLNKLKGVFEQLSLYEQPIDKGNTQNWEMLNSQFHELLCTGKKSPWTQRTLKLLSQHSERYRHIAINISLHDRDLHAEHASIYDAVMAGNELRAALAVEDHIRTTTNYIVKNFSI
jgi:DNA-binding GntR family transcriptional regulator